MLKRFIILLLGLGFFPVIISPITAQSKVDISDAPLVIRAKMHACGLRAKDISRPLGLSESYINRVVNKQQTKRLDEVIKFINDYKAKASK